MRGGASLVAAAALATVVANAQAAGRGWTPGAARDDAIASCLAAQRDAVLRDQGEAWAATVVQRGPGDPDRLRGIAAAVRAEVARSDVPIMHDAEQPMAGKPLWVAWCVAVPDRAPIRAAVGRAIAR